MSLKKIQNKLESALLSNEEMSNDLFNENLINFKDKFIKSMIKDNEDVIFALDENNNQIAMLLIEKNGNYYRNAEAKSKLKEYWKSNYEQNLKKIIPYMAKQLKAGEIAVTGFTVHATLNA
jgi:hypothetical protein